MADESKEQSQGLSEEELQSQSGEALPDREAMSVVWIEPDMPLPEGSDTGGATVDGKHIPVDHGLDQGGNEPLGGGEQL
jgi:hypothetical protein